MYGQFKIPPFCSESADNEIQDSTQYHRANSRPSSPLASMHLRHTTGQTASQAPLSHRRRTNRPLDAIGMNFSSSWESFQLSVCEKWCVRHQRVDQHTRRVATEDAGAAPSWEFNCFNVLAGMGNDFAIVTQKPRGMLIRLLSPLHVKSSYQR